MLFRKKVHPRQNPGYAYGRIAAINIARNHTLLYCIYLWFLPVIYDEQDADKQETE